MPSFVVYEVVPQGADKPYAFVPQARDARQALASLQLAGAGFVARESHGGATGDALCAQYRTQVRDVARHSRRR